MNERATACLISGLCAVSQSTRNKAIIAVTKSAYATFQAPPPLPAIGHSFRPGWFRPVGGVHGAQAHLVLSAFNMASSSSADGLTSVGRPRRATSTAMTGAMPLAKPITELAMQRL